MASAEGRNLFGTMDMKTGEELAPGPACVMPWATNCPASAAKVRSIVGQSAANTAREYIQLVGNSPSKIFEQRNGDNLCVIHRELAIARPSSSISLNYRRTFRHERILQ